MHYTCPSCGAINRIPEHNQNQQGQCGRCKSSLFTGQPIELGDADFQRFIDKNDLPVIVDFWASWCGPCQAMAPVFQQTTAEMEHQARFAKVNTEQARQISAQYGIRSIPTLIVFKHGQEVERMSGALPAPQLKEWIKQVIQAN